MEDNSPLDPITLFIQNNKYIRSAQILPLPDGRVALLHRYKLHGIYSSWESLVIALHGLDFALPKVTPVKVSLTDLGL